MPVLKKRVVKENYVTAYATSSVDVTIKEATNLTVNSIDSNISPLFFNTVVELLTASGMEFTYDASNYSINIFGITLYVLCKISNSSINHLGAAHPWVLYDGQLDIANGLTCRGTSINPSAISYYTKANSITHFELLQYQVNLYYNTNYICVTYNSATHINKEYPLFTLVQCKDHANKEYIYLTNSISDVSFTQGAKTDSTGIDHCPTAYVQQMFKNLIDTENVYREINNVPRTNEANLTLALEPEYYFPEEYSDKVLMAPLTLCNGAITAENIIINKKTYTNFIEGSYYNISGDTYYCLSGYNNGTIIALLKM